MKIGIIGTRGIPNNYGGFEQFAESLSVFLAKNGHEVFVYNSSYHPYKETRFKGVNIVHCYDPENIVGTPGQFIYDFNCIQDTRKRNFDVILQLGYTSSSIWSFLFPKKSILITNMDGLEWKRSKYSYLVRRFLRYAEKLAIEKSDHLISDSKGIKNYIRKKYNKNSTYIPYGSRIFTGHDREKLKKYKLLPFEYNMLIARIEPENNIETILDGILESAKKMTFIVVGNHNANKYSSRLKKKYRDHNFIRFLGAIYDQDELNNLRYFSNIYYHGHSVGGTNPSLLEAMASNCLIVAHSNEFNRYILENNGHYFSNKRDIRNLNNQLDKKDENDKLEKNITKIKSHYSEENINQLYLSFFHECLK